MIYLLLGDDDFSKKEFAAELQKKEAAEAESFFDFGSSAQGSGTQAILNAAMNNSLFGGKRVLKIYDFFASGTLEGDDLAAFIAKLAGSGTSCIFIEQKLDKRKSETKKLLADKSIKVLEFERPQAAEFKKWAETRAGKYGFKFGGNGNSALDLFVQRLGIDAGDFGGVSYDLWQSDSELQKLGVFSSAKVDQGKPAEVTAAEVADLIAENIDENIFKITNAIGDKDRKLATKYLMDYMDRLAGTDEKTKVISLSGLLADQFRGILLVQDLLAKRANDSAVAAATGFSSGRVFVFKKLAARFTAQKVAEALKKLELLDEEVKTSQGPAALQFFMIIDSVMK